MSTVVGHGQRGILDAEISQSQTRIVVDRNTYICWEKTEDLHGYEITEIQSFEVTFLVCLVYF